MNKLSSLSILLRKASLFQEAVSVNILKHSADQSEIDFQNGQTVKPEYGHQEGDLSKVQTMRPPFAVGSKTSDGAPQPAERTDKNGNILQEEVEVDAASTIKNSRIGSPYSYSIDTRPSISLSDIKDSTLMVSVVKGSAIHHSMIEGHKSTIIDSAIVDSKLDGEFIIKDSVSITNSTLSSVTSTCTLKDRVTIINSNCKDVNLTATWVKQSELNAVELAEYSQFESSKISYSKEIRDCKFVNSDIVAGNATSSTCLNVKGARFRELILATIEDCNDISASIRGASKDSQVYIRYANLKNSVSISGSAKIIGHPSQYAEVGEFAQVRGNATVTGHVRGGAIVEGNAEIHGQCTISGTCIVGGTAKMISGHYTTGKYMSGEHSGGSKGVLQSAVDSTASAVSAVKETYDKLMGNKKKE
jgi:hypothetical protein